MKPSGISSVQNVVSFLGSIRPPAGLTFLLWKHVSRLSLTSVERGLGIELSSGKTENKKGKFCGSLRVPNIGITLANAIFRLF